MWERRRAGSRWLKTVRMTRFRREAVAADGGGVAGGVAMEGLCVCVWVGRFCLDHLRSGGAVV